MNQMIVNMLQQLTSHENSIGVLDTALTEVLKAVRKNKKKIFFVTVLGAVGWWQHDKDICKLKKQVEELEYKLESTYEEVEAKEE